MRIVSRLVVMSALLVQFVTAGLGLLVFLNASTVGNTVIMADSDAYALLVCLALSLFATTILAIKLWRASRRRTRLERATRSAVIA